MSNFLASRVSAFLNVGSSFEPSARKSSKLVRANKSPALGIKNFPHPVYHLLWTTAVSHLDLVIQIDNTSDSAS